MVNAKKNSKNSGFKRPSGDSSKKKSRSNHSLNPDRKVTGKTSGNGSSMRTKSTINRLRMYKNFKPIRDSKGKITKSAPFQATLKSGTVARVEPHRKWFGNTRVVGQEQLQRFQEEMGKARHDPFQVVMRQTRAPISLLQEKAKQQRMHILDTESFEHTFGKKAQRKKAQLKVNDLEEFCEEAQQRADGYVETNDRSLLSNQQRALEERTENPTPLFRAGQSARVWSELYKVIDSSDVVIEVLDARDPMGTRCRQVEQFLQKEKPHKHLVLVLNKVDLVPNWVTKKWLQILSKEIPTIAFHASIQHSFGKGALINLLRQFYRLHRKERQQISVGMIGYPNVGKSSVINTLRAKKVCKSAPLAGETKVWQYVMMMKGIYLIDCPGVVYPPHGDTETDLVLKGVVRVENVPDPENHIQTVLDRVRPAHLRRHYNFVKSEGGGANGEPFWTNCEDFMTKIALSSGRLLKGGEPDLNTVARQILNDYQRGNLPHYVVPPGCERTLADDDDDTQPDEVQEKDERPITVVEEDERAQVTDSEYEDGKGADEEVEEEDGEEKVKEEVEEEGEKDNMDDPSGEKAILRAILKKKKSKLSEEGEIVDKKEEDETGADKGKEREEDEEDGTSSVVTDFEFQFSTTDDDAEMESIGSDLEGNGIGKEEKRRKTIGGKRARGKRGGTKNANKKQPQNRGRTGRAAAILGATNSEKTKDGGREKEGVVSFEKSKHSVPRNMWYKKLAKRTKAKHQQ
ncbi:hypothetical protein niasHT_006762 [Heterodera trifolii]|uniref:Nucleolar GTP-binding protein 2 n=1 Tax=Heterodera trifolii TaxID=157864 RepID=A0ABD2LWP8_9BILA